MSLQARLPPVVSDLLHRLGIDPVQCVRSDGRFTIDVSDCGPIDLVPASSQRIVLDAVIGPVDSDAQLRRKRIEKVLKFAASRMLSHSETVALSEDGEMLHLQSHLDAGMSLVETEDAMNDYLNAIAQWRMALEAPSSGSSFGATGSRIPGLP